jgi:prepilin-type N-terminal cleavage/methylation domain-containing protein
MKKQQSGFTIVELVTAIVVMGIIIPAVSIALTNLAVVNHLARDQSLANFIAQNEVETLRSAGYNNLTAGTTNISSMLPSTIGSPKSASYTITNDTPTTGVKRVDISISYTEYRKTRSLSYRTYISELGIGQ